MRPVLPDIDPYLTAEERIVGLKVRRAEFKKVLKQHFAGGDWAWNNNMCCWESKHHRVRAAARGGPEKTWRIWEMSGSENQAIKDKDLGRACDTFIARRVMEA